MKTSRFIFGLFCFLALSRFSLAVCPEEPNDLGECDTLYVEPWPADTILDGCSGGSFLVRVPIFLTNDVVDEFDSLAAFIIPLCYTHSNPSAYCSVNSYWNNAYLYPYPDIFLQRSVFRHFINPIDSLDTLVHNWMMDQSQKLTDAEWDTRIIHVDGTTRFGLACFTSSSSDHYLEAGSRTLLATVTFAVEDTMNICIDTCSWPNAWNLGFITNGHGFHNQIPRPGTGDPNSFKVCFDLLGAGFTRGDANGDGVVDPADVVYLINYLFRNGPAPDPLEAGDCNCDGSVGPGDVVYLLNYLFRSGPPPCQE